MKLRHAVGTGRLLSKNSRSQNVVFSGLLAAFAAYLQTGAVWNAVQCYGMVVLLYAVAMSLNNLADVRTDTLNKRHDNPLVGRTLSHRKLYTFTVACMVGIGLLQLGLRQPWTLLLTTVYLALSYVYSSRYFNVQSRGYWATTLLAICYGSLPLLLGVLQGDRVGIWFAIGLSVVPALLIWPLLLAKDYKDLVGDRVTGKRTPLVRYGEAKIRQVAGFAVLVALSVFVTFAHAANLSVLGIVLCSLLYAVGILQIHRSKNQLPRLVKLGALSVLLYMTLSLV
jgi:4-hydroxybenzoate polyprenyltransferase